MIHRHSTRTNRSESRFTGERPPDQTNSGIEGAGTMGAWETRGDEDVFQNPVLRLHLEKVETPDGEVV